MKIAVLSSLALAASLSNALHVSIQKPRSLHRLGSTRMSKTRWNASASLEDLQKQLYLGSFEVGGSSFTLAVDTGSSDLWFVPGIHDSAFANAKMIKPKLSLNITYGTGSIAGYLAQLDRLSFAGLNITNQTYLSVTAQDSFLRGQEALMPAFQGIAGLSFDTLSSINDAVTDATHQTWGRSLMSNIFLQNPSMPRLIAFFLNRAGDLSERDAGTLHIGSYAPGYEGVAKMPKHKVFSVAKDNRGWDTLLNGISIGGKRYKVKSAITANESDGLVNVPPKGTLPVLLDTGTTQAELPADVYKALYESMGGVLMSGTSVYAVPCMAEVRLEFRFGKQTIPVHPLDLTEPRVLTNHNLTYCASLYEISTSEGAILGDAFLRNVYAAYSYGEFDNTESGLKPGTPFVQLLPLTNPKTASADFKKSRAQTLSSLPPEVNVATINDASPQPLHHSSGCSNPALNSD